MTIRLASDLCSIKLELLKTLLQIALFRKALLTTELKDDRMENYGAYVGFISK